MDGKSWRVSVRYGVKEAAGGEEGGTRRAIDLLWLPA